MKKRMSLILPLIVGIVSLCYAQPQRIGALEKRLSAPIYDVPDGEANIYGYLRFDKKHRTYGLVGFKSNNPGNSILLKDYGNVPGETRIFTAGTYVGTDYYCYETILYANVIMPQGISVVDPITGAFVKKSSFPEGTRLIIDEMTYDPKTDRIFAMHYNTQEFITDLYEINKTSLALAKVATINQPFFTLSADDGYLYAVAAESDLSKANLVRINQSTINATSQTCTVEKVSPASGVGLNIGDYSQTMEFDKTTHRLWWQAQAHDGKAYFVELDPVSGKVIKSVEDNTELQLLAMGIPYQYVNEEAPSYVRKLAVKAGDDGQKKATLTWETPTQNYRNKPLASLTGVKIFRNNELVKDITVSTTGTAMSWVDENITNDDYYIYKVVPYNSNDNGIYKEAGAFVGEDFPGAPENVSLSATGDLGTLTWDAPSKGAHEGYFDKASLSYDVVRLPDNVKIADHITGRNVTDRVSKHAGYRYTVVAYNRKGEGTSATSNSVAFGSSESIPFISKMDSNDDFRRWTSIDNNNDNMTWKFNPTTSSAYYDRSDKEADDWLVTPPLSFVKDKKYQLRYTYYSSNWINEETLQPVMEKMKVFYGLEPTVSGLTAQIKDLGEFHTASNTYYYGKDIFSVNNTSEGYIAFKACSEANHGQIFLKDVSLREYSDHDLSIKSLTGSETANCDVEQGFVATIINEGAAPVSNYTVELFNADTKELLASATGNTIALNAKEEVSVKWTPTAEGEFNLSARVVLAGDTYPEDNSLTTTFKVKVAPSSAGKWITLNSDETSGWMTPFFLASPYSQAQCLYLENEIQKKDIEFLAMHVKYDGKTTSPFTFPAKISIKKTDYTDLVSKDKGYIGVFEEEGWTEVYKGDLTINGKVENADLIINFDHPFHYTGGNINIKFEAYPRKNRLSPSNHVQWHEKEIFGKARSARYDGQTETVKENEIFPSQFVPFMMLEYREGGSSGIISLGNNTLDISQRDNILYFSSTCEQVELYSTSGSALYTGRNIDKLDLSSLSSDVYIVKITNQGMTQSVKVVVKK